MDRWTKWIKNKYFIFVLLLILGSGFLFFREYKKIKLETGENVGQEEFADCAIVLTGGPNRVREGFDLLNNSQVKKLIISGVYTNAKLREIMPLWPFYGNLRESDVVLERRSETTYGNAQQTLPLAEALNCRDIILITSQVHMYRAYRTFVGHFPSQIVIYKHPVIGPKYFTDLLLVTEEVLKSLFYSIWAY